MNHAITLGDLMPVVYGLLALGGLAALVALIFFFIWLMNPFRSGH